MFTHFHILLQQQQAAGCLDNILSICEKPTEHTEIWINILSFLRECLAVSVCFKVAGDTVYGAITE